MSKKKNRKSNPVCCIADDKVLFSWPYEGHLENVAIVVWGTAYDVRESARLAAAFVEAISEGSICDREGKELEKVRGARKRWKKYWKNRCKESRRKRAAGEPR